MATTPSSQVTVVLVLANERSRRSTTYKALMPLKGGTMLEFVTTLAINLGVGPVAIIAGEKLTKPSTLPDEKISWCKDESKEQNHYSGIATGLFAMEEQSRMPDRVIVITCTHPYLTIGHLNKLLSQHDSGKFDMVVSEYGKDIHLPAVIGKKVFPDFHIDSKKKDLDQMLHSKKFRVANVMLPNGTIDIDSREDYLNRLGG